MLVIGYAISGIYSIPQAFIFHVASPAGHPNFTQCVSFNSFASDAAERYYNFFTVAVMYFIPLTIIAFCYFSIYSEVCKRKGKFPSSTGRVFRHSNIVDNSKIKLVTLLDAAPSSVSRLRMNNRTNVNKTMVRTLRMTIIIVLTFFVCWTPYVIMTVWYMIDWDSARSVINANVQDILFIMALSNSCLNPVIYGRYTRFLKFGTGKSCWSRFERSPTVSSQHHHTRKQQMDNLMMTTRRYQQYQHTRSSVGATSRNSVSQDSVLDVNSLPTGTLRSRTLLTESSRFPPTRASVPCTSAIIHHHDFNFNSDPGRTNVH
uniref:Gonadotropin-releasing hormone receptor n=1 Tax=Cacopsylla melanoneura TaxID=428564 RepID=A0A8D8ZAE7_9HEMI